MADAYLQYVDDDTGMVARWHGGAYIDLGYIQHQGEPGIDSDNFHAYDVINVWDYAAGKATIPFTPAAMIEVIEEHLKDEEDDDEEDDDDND
jgi:hypothetical protein